METAPKPQPLWNALRLFPQAWPLEELNVPLSLALGIDYNFFFPYPFNISFRKNMIIYFPLTSLLKLFKFIALLNQYILHLKLILHGMSITLP